MAGILYTISAWLVGSLVARVLSGAGLVLLTAAWIGTEVNELLNLAGTYIGGVAAPILQLMGLGGVGQGLAIVGSAMLGRVAYLTAQRIVSIGRAA